MAQKKCINCFPGFCQKHFSYWQIGSNYLKYNKGEREYKLKTNIRVKITFFYYYLPRCMMMPTYGFVSFCFLLVWKRLLPIFRKIVFIGLGCHIQARKKV